ncbi:MAG: ABC transporter substrate-binding protein [Rhodobacteraceae bacterium]|jgi:peptide/nickel transport system substrate-binding protein|nr:ABC transporter substrate-binding protein [Paracoccaceae bacterium]
MRLRPMIVALMLAAGPALAGPPDSLVLGMQLEPPNLDPTAGAAGAIDEVVYANLFEGLTRFREDGSIAPGLAESWEVSEDGRSYTFHLRDGVRFHDGTAFDAGDVVFSLDRARGPDSTNAQKALFDGIEAVTALDPGTVRVDLGAPDSGFLWALAWGDAVILAPETADAAATAPVGTGPFRFDRWVRGDRVELARNDAYWGAPVALDRAVFRFISDPTAAYAALLAGDIDAFPNVPAPETLMQFKADPHFQVTVGLTEGETILAINNARPPLDDIRVRRAIAHAIDRQALIDGALYGYGTPIGSHFAPHHPAYVDLTGLSAYDPDAARSLLAEAGFADGLRLTLTLPPPAYARRGGEIVAAQLRAVGIDARIEAVEWAQWLERVFRGHDYDLTIVSHTEPHDIGIYARPDYYFGYDNPEMGALMARLRAAPDTAGRNAILAEAQAIIARDQVNAFLFQLARTGVADARLRGLWANAPVQANDLTGVYWAE